MNRLSRATALKIAAGLSFLLGVWGFVDAIPYLIRGATDVSQASDAPPYFVVVSGFVFAIVKLVAAYGVWQNQRWGIVLMLLTTGLDTLAAVPGIFFAPTMYLWVGSMIGTILGSAIIVLCLWRERKPVRV